MVKFNEVLNVTQAVKNIMSVLRLVSKESAMGATKNNITIKKNGVNNIIDSRKDKN